MKKKAIEKMPYLTLPKVCGKEAGYVAVTTLEEIGQEPCLLVEVYRNKKGCRDIPAARIALTGKDFGTYLPASGKWTRRNIMGDAGPIWTEDDGCIRKTVGAMAEENILHSGEDLERIRGFFKGVTVLDGGATWWEYIRKGQEAITRRESASRTERRAERRQQALRERGENTPGLPEQRILQYADEVFFRNRHYLYYKKHGGRATIACSACGSVADARWKEGTAYESLYEKRAVEPGRGRYGICPSCGNAGIYMPQGRAKSSRREGRYLFLGQKYKGAGMVFRYVYVEKGWQLEQGYDGKGLVMSGACERVTACETARIYFEPGRKIQKDYHKHNPWEGGGFWDDCNLGGLANIYIRPAAVMPETYEDMKGTYLQYSAMEGYQEQHAGDINPAEYLERYLQTPQIEMLVKLHLTRVVDELIMCRYGIVADVDARRPDGFLGIRKEKVGLLREHGGDLGLLRVLQMEKRNGQEWTDGQVRGLEEAGIEGRMADTALRHMTVQQLLNRIKRYAGCDFGTGCSSASMRLRQTARTYLDYLDMREGLGYSLENTVYLQPRDLDAAHGRMVYENNEREQDRRIEEVERRFPLIRKDYRRLRRRYFYEDGTYQIRPARSAGEIVMEGRILHHCVGGDRYLEKHNTGESIILLLRYREDPETPYITVEIGRDHRIRQWYGAHDKKPDQKNMQRWLDAYEARLRCGDMAAGADGAAGACQRVQAPA